MKSKAARAPSPPKAISIPQPSRAFYPFETMKVGEAFIAPRSQENSLRSASSRYKRKLGKNFTVRRLTAKDAEEFGKKGDTWVGVWRLEDDKASQP